MENNRTKQQMKKTLLVALAVLMSAAAFAQFTAAPRPLKEATLTKGINSVPVWDHIATPFVARTIDGDTVDLQAILNSGMSVVIDYSCCWCPPCWNLHQSGLLDAINEMDSVQVIWVESESSNTTAQIYGPEGGSTYSDRTLGDWTHVNGQPVTYPIIDDDANSTCLRTCLSLYANAVPSVFFIAPNGYYCDFYGVDYGIDTYDANTVIARVQNLINTYPKEGRVPAAGIAGPDRVRKGTTNTFTAQIATVDPIRRISWTFQGGTPATSSDESVNVTWTTPGNYTITLEVSNDNGSTTTTFDVEVFEYNWGNTMSYFDGEYYTGIGLNGGGTMVWAALFPAEFMAGRQYIKNAEVYMTESGFGPITMTIYQGGESAPETQIYSRTYNINSEGWITLNVSGAVALDQHKSLWVTFTSNAAYPASCGDYCGDANGSWLGYQGQWMSLLDAGYEKTWMIRVTTGDEGNAGISTLENAKIAIYPNPVTDKATVVADNLSKVEVLDVTGRIVATTNQSVVDMSSLQNGVYMFRVITANGTTMQKVVKK